MDAITVTFDYTDSDSAREREFARIESQHGPGRWEIGAGSCAARAVFEFHPTPRAVRNRLEAFRQTASETFSEFGGDPRERRDRLAMLDAWEAAQTSGDASRIREVEDSILTY